jgi:hypothetical protein
VHRHVAPFSTWLINQRGKDPNGGFGWVAHDSEQ